jgi:hypothetical protein
VFVRKKGFWRCSWLFKSHTCACALRASPSPARKNEILCSTVLA